MFQNIRLKFNWKRERERVDFVYLQVVKYLRGLIFDRIFFETCVSFVFVEFLKMKLRNTI